MSSPAGKLIKKKEALLLPFIFSGSPHLKHSELFFEKKQLIPALQQLVIPHPRLTA